MQITPRLEQALRYARDTWDDAELCEETRLSCRRFLDDLDSGRWDFRTPLAEFLFGVFDTLALCQGEDAQGRPLRGRPLELMPWHVFCTYNIAGFYLPGTEIRRFSEAGIFAPRKTVKSIWGEGLIWGMALYYKASGAKSKTVAGSLKQGMEGFDFLNYNLERMGLVAENNPPGYLARYGSSLDHAFRGDVGDGYIDLQTLAYKPDVFDAFNAMLVHLDELELYKDARPYGRLKDATKGYTNKLILTTFTAGDDGNSFAASHVDYLCKILHGTIQGPDVDRIFSYVARAPQEPDGSVDFTSPRIHRAANPAYGITIKPDDMLASSLQAKNNPTLRKEFLTRSLNVFVNSKRAWFDVDEFRRSDSKYSWTEAELCKQIKSWYGGADLSKLHDLTAGCLVGEIDDVLVILPHCWFPVTAASEKADRDHIPLFGWLEDGWLDMSNDASINHGEIVRWFKSKRDAGFRVRQVGHDRKFARDYFSAMKAAGFTVVDQPQLHIKKNEGFRYIEAKAKNGQLYYFHAEPFEYCVANVHAVEKADDAVQYDKIMDHLRIDVFDAAVFAVVRMLEDREKRNAAAGWH